MPFSFADLGFWRLTRTTLIFELLHAILESHWSGIRGSRLGPRPLSAVLFMSFEAFALIFTTAAAIGLVTRLVKLPTRPSGQIVRVILAVVGLGGIFFWLWQT
jgi:hypothetical protein